MFHRQFAMTSLPHLLFFTVHPSTAENAKQMWRHKNRGVKGQGGSASSVESSGSRSPLGHDGEKGMFV
ncbi:hypothetical protein NL676_014612 [Syzygium grande]|nr:hypothetical protein NL676_014612 [Syzygium grande]